MIKSVVKKIQNDFPFKGYFQKRYIGKYEPTLKIITKHLKKDSKILDFGSGPGEFVAMLNQLNFDCYACDDLQDPWHLIGGNREKIKNYYKENNVKFELIEKEIPFQNVSFDLIMINHVLEHIHDSPRFLLSELLSLLKKDGLLLITVPSALNIRKRMNVLRGKTNYPPYKDYFNHSGDKWRGHVREYSVRDLEQLAEYLELDIIYINGVDHMLNRIPKYLQPFYLAFTSLAPFTKDSLLFLGKK